MFSKVSSNVQTEFSNDLRESSSTCIFLFGDFVSQKTNCDLSLLLSNRVLSLNGNIYEVLSGSTTSKKTLPVNFDIILRGSKNNIATPKMNHQRIE